MSDTVQAAQMHSGLFWLPWHKGAVLGGFKHLPLQLRFSSALHFLFLVEYFSTQWAFGSQDAGDTCNYPPIVQPTPQSLLSLFYSIIQCQEEILRMNNLWWQSDFDPKLCKSARQWRGDLYPPSAAAAAVLGVNRESPANVNIGLIPI